MLVEEEEWQLGIVLPIPLLWEGNPRRGFCERISRGVRMKLMAYTSNPFVS